MRALAILLSTMMTLVLVCAAGAAPAASGKAAPGKAGPAARPGPVSLPEVSGLIDQFKAGEGTTRTAAQLDAACAAIVAAAMPALESDEPGLHQVGRTTTLDFAFYVSRPGAETRTAGPLEGAGRQGRGRQAARQGLDVPPVSTHGQR